MLMLSSGAMRGDAQHCKEVGISGFFSKPIAAEELLAALCRVFDLCRDNKVPDPEHLVTRDALRELQQSLDILLVEDHLTNQKLAISLLEKWGHRTSLAVNGQEAVAMTAEHRYDLVLMDMQMPVMSGTEATRIIRARESANGLPPVPIIAMTAAATPEDQAACIAAGMDDYIPKPIKTRLLMEKLLALGGQKTAAATPAGFDYAAALRAADQETVEIIAGVFLDTWQRDMAQLRNALAEDDLPVVERTAHSFRGSLACFAAEPAVQAASHIEKQARSRSSDNLASLIDRLDQEIQALCPHLQNINERLTE
jgi:hypothetical protein